MSTSAVQPSPGLVFHFASFLTEIAAGDFSDCSAVLLLAPVGS
jgi:hypothetical protein